MKERILCKLFGFHKYEVYDTETVEDGRGNIIGKIIISRCAHCGKLKSFKYYTENVHSGI